MTFEIGLILLLILVNGVFAMSEMAIASARKVRLQQLGKSGNSGAKKALELAEYPTRFLSTIQVGITSIGILSGALGEEIIANLLLPYLQSIPSLAPYAEKVALIITVATITYLFLIFGELVPKRLALNFPERIATWVARPMHILSLAALPAVKLLSLSTELVLWLLRIKPKNEPTITQDEIRLLLAQGAEEGVFEEVERQFMENILRLDNIKVGSIMTPRKDIAWLDMRRSFAENRQRIADNSHWVLPLCDGGLEIITGFIKTKDILDRVLMGEQPELSKIAVNALFVPDSLTVIGLLEQFRKSPLHTALVVDEYGEIDGLVALGDVLEAIVGIPPAGRQEEKPDIVQREDGSWLVDGMLDIFRLKELFELDDLSEERDAGFHTLGGFIMHYLGQVPKITDHFEFDGLRFEVVDMDGNRVDKVLISKTTEASDDTNT